MYSNLFVIRCAIVAALGGLLFGFDTAVISGTTEALERVFIEARFADASEGVKSFWKGFTVACALIGTIIGAAAIGPIAERLGRRASMFGLALLFLVSAAGCAIAWSWESLVIFRFIGGLGIGGASVVAPMYIAEIAPPKQRGMLAGLAQFNIVFGILLAFLSNYLVQQLGPPQDGDAAAYTTWLDERGWRIMFGVEVVPALAYAILLFTVPRSPRWLISRGREDEAKKVLAKLSPEGDDVAGQVEAIKASVQTDAAASKVSLFQSRYRVPIMLAFAIAAFNQLSGINAILYYAPEVFKSAGFGDSVSFLTSVGVGLANLVCTMAALAVIDRLGRKKLMIVGSIGYLISLWAVAIAFFTQSGVDAEGARTFSDAGSYVVVGGIILFIASHAFGQGAVIWVFLSEIFPNSVRAKGQAFGSLIHWVFAAAISWTFPIIAEAVGGLVFAFYGLCMIGQLVWVFMAMPETKNVPLEEIEHKLGIQAEPDTTGESSK